MLGFNLRQALLYSFTPNRLGFCGPQDNKSGKIIFDYLANKKEKEDKIIKKILKNFQGVYLYCRLIAKKNRIKDPFDSRVLEAYWIGNSLLEKITFSDLKNLISSEFVGPKLLTKNKALNIVNKIPEGVLPHHSFHVLFIGSITGSIILKGKLLNLCRISWGRVKRIKNNGANKQEKQIIVQYRPLAIKNKKIYLGKIKNKEILWDSKFLPELKAGDAVSFHWNFVCGILSGSQRKNLEKYTKRNLRLLKYQ